MKINEQTCEKNNVIINAKNICVEAKYVYATSWLFNQFVAE